MPMKIHLMAGLLATLTIATFFISKKKRMPFIAVNGLFVLVPSAIFLNRWAALGAFDTMFYLVQSVELVAGAANLTLMGLNIRDGLKISGRFHAVPKAR